MKFHFHAKGVSTLCSPSGRRGCGLGKKLRVQFPFEDIDVRPLSYKSVGLVNDIMCRAMNVRLLLVPFFASLLLASVTEGLVKRHAGAYQKRFFGFLSQESKEKLQQVAEEAVKSLLGFFWNWFK